MSPHDPTTPPPFASVLTPADVARVRGYLLDLQQRIVEALEIAGGEPFLRDAWVRPADGRLTVAAWRTGRGDEPERRRFVIDYYLGAGAQSQGVEGDVTVSSGRILNLATSRSPLGDLFRLAFEVDPGGADAVELRASLVRAKRVISEVWTYRCPPN